jgi:uncharacterized protein
VPDLDVTALAAHLAAEPAIVCAWLFGSRARGTARPDSDVDVAVLAELPRGIERHDWKWDLEARLTTALRLPVQVVLVDRAPADLVRRILREDRLLLDRDPKKRVAMEVKKRMEYFDMTPIWRRIRRLPPGMAP